MLFILRTSEGVLYGLKEAFANSADSILLEQESADYGPKTKSSLLPVRAKNGLYSCFFLIVAKCMKCIILTILRAAFSGVKRVHIVG